MSVKKKEKTKHITVRVPEDLIKSMDRLTAKLSRTRSQIIILAVKSFITNEK